MGRLGLIEPLSWGYVAHMPLFNNPTHDLKRATDGITALALGTIRSYRLTFITPIQKKTFYDTDIFGIRYIHYKLFNNNDDRS